MAGAAQGGAESAFEDIVLALHEAGIPQHIVMRGNNAGRVSVLRQAGLSVDILPFGGIVDAFTSWKLRCIIKKYKPDIVQTWMSRAAQKMPRVDGVINVARLGGYYKLKYYRSMDYFVANTPDIARYLTQQGIAAGRVTHINNFAKVDDVLHPVTKGDLNTPQDAPVAVALARYHPVKALDILIRAAAPIHNLHVWLAGQGDEEVRLKSLAESLGIQNRVHFLGWRTDRAALLKAADICVVPSRFEPFGNVMVQAWAAQIPLICSDSQGPAQYARHEQDSLMFPIDNVPELTMCLGRLISDADLCARLTRAGHDRFVREFSKEQTVAAYSEFYQSLITRRDVKAA